MIIIQLLLGQLITINDYFERFVWLNSVVNVERA